MVSPARQFSAAAGEERVLAVVRELVAELGHAAALRSAGLASHLERDLGLGSLERVELLLRLDKAFGTRLDENVLAAAETVQDLVAAVGAATVTRVPDGQEPFGSGAQAEGVAGAAGISSPGRARTSDGLAEGIPSAETFQEVLRHRGRVDASRTHLIFYEDDAEGPSLTFGELLEGADRVAADLAQRGIGRGDTVALMLPTSRDFFLTFAGTLLAGATPVPIYPPFRADRIAEYAERQSAILANAGARLLVTFREAASVAKLLKPLVPSLEGVATAEALAASRAPAPLGPSVHARAGRPGPAAIHLRLDRQSQGRDAHARQSPGQRPSDRRSARHARRRRGRELAAAVSRHGPDRRVAHAAVFRPAGGGAFAAGVSYAAGAMAARVSPLPRDRGRGAEFCLRAGRRENRRRGNRRDWT